jgi:hypothetical protein
VDLQYLEEEGPERQRTKEKKAKGKEDGGSTREKGIKKRVEK